MNIQNRWYWTYWKILQKQLLEMKRYHFPPSLFQSTFMNWGLFQLFYFLHLISSWILSKDCTHGVSPKIICTPFFQNRNPLDILFRFFGFEPSNSLDVLFIQAAWISNILYMGYKKLSIVGVGNYFFKSKAHEISYEIRLAFLFIGLSKWCTSDWKFAESFQGQVV